MIQAHDPQVLLAEVARKLDAWRSARLPGTSRTLPAELVLEARELTSVLPPFRIARACRMNTTQLMKKCGAPPSLPTEKAALFQELPAIHLAHSWLFEIESPGGKKIRVYPAARDFLDLGTLLKSILAD